MMGVVVENKREFFRLRLSIPFTFSVIESKDPRIATNQVYAHQTEDLSGGGLRFETHLSLHTGDRLQLSLHLPTMAPVKVDAEIVWSQQIQTPEEELNIGGIKFLDIDDEEQDRIIGFLFRAQIEARKKHAEPKEAQGT